MNHCDFCKEVKGSPCVGLQHLGCTSFKTWKQKLSLPTDEEITRDVIAAIPELDRRESTFEGNEVVNEKCHRYNTPRSQLLDEVMEIVHKDRNANYGNPENNFQQIADLWNAYCDALRANRGRTDILFTPADVAIMNMLIKVARLAKNPNHHDSAVDIAGYAACLADVQASSASK